MCLTPYTIQPKKDTEHAARLSGAGVQAATALPRPECVRRESPARSVPGRGSGQRVFYAFPPSQRFGENGRKTAADVQRRRELLARLALRSLHQALPQRAPGLGLPQREQPQQPRLERQLLVRYAQLRQRQQRVQPQLQQRQPQPEQQQQPLQRAHRPPRRSTRLSLGHGKHWQGPPLPRWHCRNVEISQPAQRTRQRSRRMLLTQAAL